jgi:hypothetical protein
VDGERLFDQLLRFQVISQLVDDNPQMVQGICVLGLNRKDLSVNRRSLGKTTHTVVLDGEIEGLLDGSHGRDASSETAV